MANEAIEHIASSVYKYTDQAELEGPYLESTHTHTFKGTFTSIA